MRMPNKQKSGWTTETVRGTSGTIGNRVPRDYLFTSDSNHSMKYALTRFVFISKVYEFLKHVMFLKRVQQIKSKSLHSKSIVRPYSLFWTNIKHTALSIIHGSCLCDKEWKKKILSSVRLRFSWAILWLSGLPSSNWIVYHFRKRSRPHKWVSSSVLSSTYVINRGLGKSKQWYPLIFSNVGAREFITFVTSKVIRHLRISFELQNNRINYNTISIVCLLTQGSKGSSRWNIYVVTSPPFGVKTVDCYL